MMENQGESSSSSNDINQKLEKSQETKEGAPENKKLKQDELAKNTEEQENETADTSINDLPTEMVVKILKYVDDDTLIDCRLVNKQWLEISTEIVYKRGDTEIEFKANSEYMPLRTPINGKSLGDFIQCFHKSKNCPYSSFLFRVNLNFLKLNGEGWNSFLSKFGKRIKCLRLVIDTKHGSSLVAAQLKNLLLDKIPQLEELGLTFSSKRVDSDVITTSLFPSTPPLLPLVQLPHLKVLHLSELVFSKCPKIVEDLLRAAVNLRSIRYFRQHHKKWKKFKPQDYIFLHSRGKLHLLEEAKITPSAKLFSTIKRNTNKCTSSLPFKLQNLELSMSKIYKDQNKRKDASKFISHVFESSKDSLRELKMDPVGFLPKVKFPRFTKLERFTVEGSGRLECSEPVFPSGINSMDVFPVLRSLNLPTDWTRRFPREENIPRMPSVKTLEFSDSNCFPLTENCIWKMILMCPNLKDLSLTFSYGCDQVNFPEVGRAIWTHMKQLESLELQITLDSKFNTFHALDSCFTGISKEECERIYEMMKAEEYLKRWKSQLNIPKAELESPVRESVSILDVKNLTNLKVHLHWRIRGSVSAEDIFKRIFTSVSQKYAFKLMTNLNCNIDQDFICV